MEGSRGVFQMQFMLWYPIVVFLFLWDFEYMLKYSFESKGLSCVAWCTPRKQQAAACQSAIFYMNQVEIIYSVSS